MKLIKLGGIILYLAAFAGFVVAILWFETTGVIFSISPALYWFIVPGWIALVVNLKSKSSLAYKLAFLFYIIGAVMTVLGIRHSGISEVIMRLAYLWFCMATIQAIWEYKNV